MCGIMGGWVELDSDADVRAIEHSIAALRHRGPDAQGIARCGPVWLGHTRLALLDPSPLANQPLQRDGITLVMNGEIWNFLALRLQLQSTGVHFITNSDTEVAAALLARKGVAALAEMQGMFAMAWVDERDGCLFLARDRFGEAPLHLSLDAPFRFASELKAFPYIGVPPQRSALLPPGSYAVITRDSCKIYPYYDVPNSPRPMLFPEAARQVRAALEQGVAERAISDLPFCVLLSGGIDSSAIAAVLSRLQTDLVAYLAVFDPESADVAAARKVAYELSIDLREVTVPTPSRADMARVIYHIEMPYKAQVEIGWPCLVLAERIRSDGFRIVFSGDGSDELWASYGFAQEAALREGWHAYRKKLFLMQEHKSFARANKVFMAHGIECRLPFLNTGLVELALSLGPESVQPGGRWKAVLGEAFTDLLPSDITHRAKLAFQNGLGIKTVMAKAVGSARRFYDATFRELYGEGEQAGRLQTGPSD